MAQNLDATRGPVWVRVGTLLNGTSTAPIYDAHVVYDDRAIRFVGSKGHTPPRDLLRDGQEGPDVEATDYTLLPGLIDAHVHLFLDGATIDRATRSAAIKKPPSEILSGALARLEPLAQMGVIGVRDAGDRYGVGLALGRLSRELTEVAIPLAYVDSAGAAIHHRGHYGGFMSEPVEAYSSLREGVEARVAAGADRIKIIATGAIDFNNSSAPVESQMTTAEIAEIVGTARALGRQTFAHASGDEGIGRAIDGGVDSVEHGFFIRDEQLARMRDTRTAWVPTFAPILSQLVHAEAFGWDNRVVARLRQVLEDHAESLVKAHVAGVPIVAGSDAGSAGVVHGAGLFDEMALMEHAGMPPLAVVNAATGVGAVRFRYGQMFGRVEPGYMSRFILTRHSPLDGVANLRKGRYVVFDGRVHDVGMDCAERNA